MHTHLLVCRKKQMSTSNIYTTGATATAAAAATTTAVPPPCGRNRADKHHPQHQIPQTGIIGGDTAIAGTKKVSMYVMPCHATQS